MSLRIIFAGTPSFSVPSLQALIDSEHDVIAVYTQPDRPAGRGRHLTESPIKQLAVANKIPVFQPKSLRDENAQKELKALSADLMIVAAYGLLLPEIVLETPKQGCMNVHASLLPRWRGAAPIQQAILAGDSETGITIMKMDVGLDTGDMLLKKSCPIHEEDNAQALHDRLAELGAKAIVEALKKLVSGDLQPEKQDESLATYAAKITKQDGVLEWHKSASELARQVRAYNPWPVAFTWYDEKMIRVWEAATVSEKHVHPVGYLANIDEQGIHIATGEGVLCLKKIQLPGGKIISAQDFINAKGEELIVGVTKFGDERPC